MTAKSGISGEADTAVTHRAPRRRQESTAALCQNCGTLMLATPLASASRSDFVRTGFGLHSCFEAGRRAVGTTPQPFGGPL
jgi:hypothetical protein